MGEEEVVDPMEEEAVPVTQLDMGTEAVDISNIELPTAERICGFVIEKTSSDFKWSRFEVKTQHRTLPVEPGTMGQAKFDAFCEDVAAMFHTDEGQIVLGKMKAALKTKKLKLTNVREVVEPVVEVVPEAPSA